tara:strand:+ start:9128 stop:9550 length:423 start_codon:yes stop_codon:yes gene_type:complete
MEEDGLIFGETWLPAPAHPKAWRLKDAAKQYTECSVRLDNEKASLDYLKEILLSDLPNVVGEHPIQMDDGRTLVVRIPEKLVWDKKLLKSTFEASGLPDCVSQSFTVDRKKLDAAPENVREVLKQALTITCGAPTIKVQS